MAAEVVDAGRFDKVTSDEDRRHTLERLLADADRLAAASNVVPTHGEVNARLARTPEERALYDRMDAELDWPDAVRGRGLADVEASGVAGQIPKLCDLFVEGQLHIANRTVALLANNDIGLSCNLIHLFLPSQVLLRALPGLHPAEIIAFPIDEHHHVCVLLDRARLPQVRELGFLIFPVFNLARKLRQGDDRNRKFLC